jgi:hypothetical protein
MDIVRILDSELGGGCGVRSVPPVDQTTIDQLTEQAIPPRRGR